MSKPPARSKTPPKAVSEQERQVTEIPSENVEILNDALGVDISKAAPQQILAFAAFTRSSQSSSPYSSAEMLQDYVARGFPELPPRVINTIDQQIAHRQRLEVLTTEGSERRKNRGQVFAFIVSIVGVVGALVAGYLGVPWGICTTAAIISVGGPNAATVIARWVDKIK